MSEINGTNFSVNQVNFKSTQKQTPDSPQGVTDGEEPKYKDFSNPKAEALGRSMVKDADNINNDLKALIKNPQIAENSDDLFDAAYKAALESGIENPYEEASTFATENV